MNILFKEQGSGALGKFKFSLMLFFTYSKRSVLIISNHLSKDLENAYILDCTMHANVNFKNGPFGNS